MKLLNKLMKPVNNIHLFKIFENVSGCVVIYIYI